MAWTQQPPLLCRPSIWRNSIRQPDRCDCVLAIIGWNTWFTAFHQLFFLPGTWTFTQTDTLIRLFPLPFWFDGVLTVSALTLAGGILLGVMGWVLKRRWNANMI